MIEIKITEGTPLEAMTAMAAFGYHCLQVEAVSTATMALLEREKGAAQVPNAPAAETKTPKAEKETSVPDPSPKTKDTPPREAEAAREETPVTITLKEVRAKGLAAARAHGQPAVKTLLDAFDAANITGLSPDQYAAFVAQLEGLGDGNA